jgi:membrane fusion protein (multidrug efflux system)
MPNASNRLTVLLALSTVLAACGGTAPPPQPPAPAVTVVTLKPEPITLTRELPGRTNPYLVAEVRPQVTGIVQDQLFAEGSRVDAGQPLYQLDDATYRANYNSAKASLARAEAALKVARLNANRAEELAKTGVISKQDHENAVATLQQAEADVEVAKAALASSKVVLGYARITTPIAGRIGKSSVTQGALVTANQDTPLATVQQLDPIYVDLTQSARELLQLRKEIIAGTLTETSDVPVAILLEDGSRYPHPGKMKFADVTVDPTTGSFLLRVVVPNPDNLLLPGMYVRAVVSSGKRQNGLLVPQQGITRDPKGNAIAMVVGADGKVEPRTVQVSRTVGDQWLVDGGLAAGDRVIIEGLQKVRPGMPVQVSEAAPVSTPAADGSDADSLLEPKPGKAKPVASTGTGQAAGNQP